MNHNSNTRPADPRRVLLMAAHINAKRVGMGGNVLPADQEAALKLERLRKFGDVRVKLTRSERRAKRAKARDAMLVKAEKPELSPESLAGLLPMKQFAPSPMLVNGEVDYGSAPA